MALTEYEQKYHDEHGVKKADLVDGAYYKGKCRNATQARWNAKLNIFVYNRTKFTQTFPESITCPEDAGQYDYFQPTERITEFTEVPLCWEEKQAADKDSVDSV